MQKKFPFEVILDWYKTNGRHDLPWRKQQSAYHVWISEIFLQQTQVSRVKDYFNTVVNRFPTVEILAQTDYDTFFPYYEGLGYYSRARNMLKTAQIVSKQYGWVFPDTFKGLTDLPWIWPYTAQAILSFWYQQNILAWDTNLEKIFARFYYGSRFIKLIKESKIEIQKQFEATNISARDMNAALMDFASLCDINEKNNIDFINYPLWASKFFLEKWVSESKPEKIISKIKKQDAEIIVMLHKDHREYYSQNPDLFEGFRLWKSSQDHRHFIKDYFENTFKIKLSVRPVYKKMTSKTENYFFYHAQIQLWEHDFWIFTKKDKQNWEENFWDFL